MPPPGDRALAQSRACAASVSRASASSSAPASVSVVWRGRAHEQLDPEVALERAHAPADLRLGEAQPQPGRVRSGAPRRRHERAQLPKLHADGVCIPGAGGAHEGECTSIDRRIRAGPVPGILAAMTEREVLWTPSPGRVAAATLTRYQRWLREERGVDTRSYDELWRWSVSDLDEFWGSIVEFFDVRFSAPPSAVLGRRTMPGAEWFPEGRLNYAEHVFRDRRGELDGDRARLRAVEAGLLDLAAAGEQTAQIAAGLRARGVVPGDRVVAYMPNIPETVAAFLACAVGGRDLVLGGARVRRRGR